MLTDDWLQLKMSLREEELRKTFSGVVIIKLSNNQTTVTNH